MQTFNTYKPMDSNMLVESNMKQSKYHLFRKYYKMTFSNDFKETDDWLDWFMGFTEGDGNLYSSVKYNKCSFTTTQKEITMLNHMNSVFNFGNVKLFTSKDKSLKENDILGYGRWTCYDKKYMFTLYLIFNNNLYLKNRNIQLQNWYAILINSPTDRFESLNMTNINQMPPFMYNTNKPTRDNAWISGFTDAEGCFSVTTSISTKETKIRFMLDQAEEELLLNNIGEALLDMYNVSMRKTDRPGRKSMKKMYNTSANMSFTNFNFLLVEDYFNKYPLKTNKLNNYTHWCQVINTKFSGLHNEDLFEEMNELKTKVNKF
uniref:LAGLIDADG type class1 intron encoded endonuclease, COX1-ai4 protein n=1 Tax=Yarrowia galli TaxID=197054 RepID=G4U504_9ASCO|nr:COX1-ai4 protein [Yarrowia galli]CCC29056.1 LAGLIDADG type class1 intron encoded endonuclease, COX1-ai4 protein [Yarrowia galli]